MTTAYEWLLKDQGLKPRHIALVGDSAGGALALTTIASARARDLPLPAATMPISPWAGWDISGKTYETNAHRDAFVSKDTTEFLGPLFIGPEGDRYDPLANPLYTDYSGYPPIYLTVGNAETLLDDSIRIVEKAKQAGVEVKFDCYDDMQHVFQFLAGVAPEADDVIQRMAQWVRPRIGLA
ncbi:Monoterpene epsilon-lactone hydrolase [compost metagenome]